MESRKVDSTAVDHQTNPQAAPNGEPTAMALTAKQRNRTWTILSITSPFRLAG